MDNKRKHYLDNIRWVTALAVVVYHVIYMYNAEGIPGVVGKITNMRVQFFDAYQYLVYPWLMPIFFVVSGISAKLYLDNHNSKDFIKDKTRKLLVPSTLGLFAFQFLQGLINIHLSNAYDTMSQIPFPGNVIGLTVAAILSGIGVLWYMQLLWVICLILLLVRLIEKGKLLKAAKKTPIWLIFLFVIPVWAFGLVLNTPIIVVYRLGFYTAFFMLGYYVFSSEEVMEKLKKFLPAFLIIALGLGITFTILFFGKNYADKPINRNPLFAAYGYFGSLAILTGFARFFDKKNAFASYMAKRSLGIYVFHYLGISAVGLLLARPGLLPAAVVYPLSLVAGLAAGIGLYEIISRIPVYRWFVLGIKKKKQNKT